jgi:TonB family protein
MSPRLIVPLVFSSLFGAAAAQEAPAVPSRAQRDADNPLRMIIEASKIKPRAKAVEPARAPERIQVRATVTAPAEAVPVPAAPVAAEAPPPSPIVAVTRMAEAPVAEMPPPQPRQAVPESMVGEPVVAMEPAAVRPEPLRIAAMVEPSIPRRLLDRVKGDIEVIVTFTVNTDGTVANAAVQSSTNRLVNPTVLEAVAQWRYAPLAAARDHAVQLVMRAPE